MGGSDGSVERFKIVKAGTLAQARRILDDGEADVVVVKRWPSVFILWINPKLTALFVGGLAGLRTAYPESRAPKRLNSHIREAGLGKGKIIRLDVVTTAVDYIIAQIKALYWYYLDDRRLSPAFVLFCWQAYVAASMVPSRAAADLLGKLKTLSALSSQSFLFLVNQFLQCQGVLEPHQIEAN